MARTLIGLLGAVTALFPDRILDVFESFAVENPDECTVNPWVGPGIRTEGVLVAVVGLLGGRAYAWTMNVTGAFGAVVLLFPDLYRRFATGLLYERPGDVEWNDRFTPVVRAIGALYVLLAARAFARRRTGD